MFPEAVRQNPWVRSAVTLVGIGALLYSLCYIWGIVSLFLAAFFLAYILDPAVDWIELYTNLDRVYAIAILLVVVCLFAGLLGYYLTQQASVVAQEVTKIVQNPPPVREWAQTTLPETLYEAIEERLARLESRAFYQRFIEYVRSHVTTITETVTEGSTFVLGIARRTLGVVGVAVNALVFVFAAFYFLRDFDRIIFGLKRIVPVQYRDSVRQCSNEVDELLRAFFRGHLIVSLTVGVLYGSGYMLVGLKGGFLVGFLTGLLNFIPYVGPAIGFVVAFGLGLYQFGLSGSLLGLALVFVFVQSLEGNILTPNIVGGAVGVNPVTAIFSLLVCGKLFGFLGLVFAIPLAGIVRIFLWHLFRYYRTTSLYHPRAELLVTNEAADDEGEATDPEENANDEPPEDDDQNEPENPGA